MQGEGVGQPLPYAHTRGHDVSPIFRRWRP